MENSPTSSSSKTDRKIIERNRRNQMKSLYTSLNSHIPHNSSKEPTSLPDQIDNAVNYIKKLQMKVEKLKERKETLLGSSDHNHSHRNKMTNGRLRSPVIEVHEVGFALEVVLITGLDSQLMFNEAVRVLHDEGVKIVNASFSAVDDIVFHSIHSLAGDSAPGFAAARISDRLNKFVQDSY